MRVACVDHWLRDAERLEFPLRPVIGAHATVFVFPLSKFSWRVAWSTGAPGYGARSVEQPDSVAWPNRQNAILAGLIDIRRHWQKIGVPLLVAAVTNAIRGLED